MRVKVLAVSKRQPAWVEAGWKAYAVRLPPEVGLHVQTLKPEPRNSGKTPEQIKALEAQRLQAALPPHSRVVALDEAGETVNTPQLAAYWQHWRASGQDLVFVIGGVDGLDAAFKARAHHCLRLSALTLPHGLVRVLLAEALYRAFSLSQGMPYHRA